MNRAQYLRLNPFRNTQVDEEGFWAAAESEIREIHGAPLLEITNEIQKYAVSSSDQGRVVVLRGSVGSGKTHLLGRVRRTIENEAVFFRVSEPPRDLRFFHETISRDMITCLSRPMVFRSVQQPFTQLRGILYATLRKCFPIDKTVVEVHEMWGALPNEERQRYVREVWEKLRREDPTVSPEILTGLLWGLFDDLQWPAMQWLLADSSMSGAELQSLSQKSHLDERSLGDVVRAIGYLAEKCEMPLVLNLDQLDGVLESGRIEQTVEFVQELLDRDKSWLVIFSMNHETFGSWNRSRKATLRERMNPKILDLAPLDNAEHRWTLIINRLQDGPLQARRESDAVTDPAFPFQKGHLQQLAFRELETPKEVLTEASNAYTYVLTGQVPRISLDEFLVQRMEERMVEASTLRKSPSSKELLERMTDLVQLFAGGDKLKIETGAVRREFRYFNAYDCLYRAGNEMRRAVVTDVIHVNLVKMLRRMFLRFPDAVFVRAEDVSIGRREPAGMLNNALESHQFLILSRDEICRLIALGKVLDDLKSGELRRARTDPEATDERIVERLRRMPGICDHPVLGALSVGDGSDHGRLNRPMATLNQVDATKPEPATPGDEKAPSTGEGADSFNDALDISR